MNIQDYISLSAQYNVTVIYFENMKTELESVLNKLNTFFDNHEIDVDRENRTERMNCLLNQSVDTFHRPKKVIPFDIYTPEMKQHINKAIKKVAGKTLKYFNETFALSYLRSLEVSTF